MTTQIHTLPAGLFFSFHTHLGPNGILLFLTPPTHTRSLSFPLSFPFLPHLPSPAPLSLTRYLRRQEVALWASGLELWASKSPIVRDGGWSSITMLRLSCVCVCVCAHWPVMEGKRLNGINAPRLILDGGRGGVLVGVNELDRQTHTRLTTWYLQVTFDPATTLVMTPHHMTGAW